MDPILKYKSGTLDVLFLTDINSTATEGFIAEELQKGGFSAGIVFVKQYNHVNLYAFLPADGDESPQFGGLYYDIGQYFDIEGMLHDNPPVTEEIKGPSLEEIVEACEEDEAKRAPDGTELVIARLEAENDVMKRIFKTMIREVVSYR